MYKKIFILVYLFIFNQTLLSQTVLYQESFETTESLTWNSINNCEIISEDNNYVLQTIGYAHSEIGETWGSWTDYTFSVDVKKIQGPVLLKFRDSNSGRYLVPLDEGQIQLNKTRTISGIEYNSELSSLSADIWLNEWHRYTIECIGNNIKIYMDYNIIIDYTDTDPLLGGRVGFEVFEGSTTLFDNIIVESDIINPTQDVFWTRSGGPIGGMGYDVRIHPIDYNIMFTTDVWSGVHRSDDGGLTWHEKNNGITTRLTPTNENRFGPSGDAIPVFCVTIDPVNPNIIWCATQSYLGVFKSTDLGETWTPKLNGIPPDLAITFRSFAVDPTNSDIVYLASEISHGTDEVTGKIFKTTNGGNNWFEVLNSESLIRIILIDPRNTDVIYAASGIMDRGAVEEEGLWKSEDGGNSWFHANNGISTNALTIEGLDFDSSNPDILYISTGRWLGFNRGDVCDNGAIYKSIDCGNSWIKLFSRPNCNNFVPMYLAVSPSDPNIVYVTVSSDCGFYCANNILRSFNGGETWEEFSLAMEGIRAGVPISVAVHPTQPNIVFVNYYGGGVAKSIDYGESWVNSSQGYTGAQIYDITIDGDNPSLVYCTNRVGPFKSMDGGVSWIGIGYGSAANVGEWGAIQINPNDPEELVSGQAMSYTIMKSTNGGNNWHEALWLPDIIEGDYGIVSSISWCKSNPDVVFASFYYRGNNFNVSDSSSYGIYKSFDKGETWFSVNSSFVDTKKNALTVEVSPLHEDIVFASLKNEGVYKSTNGGNSWLKKNNGISNFSIMSFAFDPTNDNTIYAGIENGGIYKSTNSGESWFQISRGMDPEASIRSIVVNPINSLELFAHDWFTGVYHSVDGGSSWYAMNDGLRTRAGQSLAISNDGKILYAGSEGDGVFRIEFDQSTSTEDEVFNQLVISYFNLSQNFPNPFNPSTTINYTVNKTEIIKIAVYDILGRELSTLVNEKKYPGNYSVVFDGRNYSSGIYFYRIKAGDFVDTKKLVLLK